MLAYLEALDALHRTGTMGAAGTALRVTQSAISKRIQSLESEVGHPLVEREGRRVVLTPAGKRLLERAAPALADLRLALAGSEELAGASLTLGVSESILSTWGADALAGCMRHFPALGLTIHAHRSPVVIDRVLSGEYHLGLVAGVADWTQDLKVETVLAEPMVVILGRHESWRWNRAKPLPVMTIEERSATWQSIARRAVKEPVVVESRLESFMAIGRLAQAGHVNGLVPLGVAKTLRIKEDRIKTFAAGRLSRPISLVGRPTSFARASVGSLRLALENALRA